MTRQTEPYKFVYALVLAALTSASVIWVGNPWITIALAGVGAVGVYFVPNPDKTPRTDEPAPPWPHDPTV